MHRNCERGRDMRCGRFPVSRSKPIPKIPAEVSSEAFAVQVTIVPTGAGLDD